MKPITLKEFRELTKDLDGTTLLVHEDYRGDDVFVPVLHVEKGNYDNEYSYFTSDSDVKGLTTNSVCFGQNKLYTKE